MASWIQTLDLPYSSFFLDRFLRIDHTSQANLHNYFDIHVCPSLRRHPSVRPVLSHFRVSSYSEFQMSSQPVAEGGKAELCILNLKTTWSEFQKPIRLLLSKAKPSYVYSILKPHGEVMECCWEQQFVFLKL